MAMSATNAIEPAFRRTGRMLFKPFNIGKWFTLGFCAWLAQLGQGGGNFQVPNFGGGRGPAVGGVEDWIKANLHWLIPVGIAAAILLVAVFLVMMWIRSRGKFMLLAGVARNQAAVVAPWKEFRVLGNNLFRFLLVLTLIGFGIVVLIVGGCLLIALPDIRSSTFGWPAGLALFTGVVLLLPALLGLGLITVATEDFIVPLMYLRNQPAMAAWREFRHSLLPGNVGAFVIFYLMRIVLGLGAAILMSVGMCLTCCLAALPYLNAVVFLPIFVFVRCYSLYFLEQFGPGYQVLTQDLEPQGFPVIMPSPPPPEA